MKKPLNIMMIAAAALVVASLAGLVITGLKIGWDPFSFLHTWDADVEKIRQSYPAEENQNGIIFYGASNFRMWTEMENDLPEYRVQNHGFGGCTDQDLMHYEGYSDSAVDGGDDPHCDEYVRPRLGRA